MCSRIILINFTAGHNQKKGNRSSQGTGSSLCGLHYQAGHRLVFTAHILHFHQPDNVLAQSISKREKEGKWPRDRIGSSKILGEPYTFSGCAVQCRVYSVHMEKTGSLRHHSTHPMSITTGPFLHLQPDFHLFFFFMENRFYSFIILKKNLSFQILGFYDFLWLKPWRQTQCPTAHVFTIADHCTTQEKLPVIV